MENQSMFFPLAVVSGIFALDMSTVVNDC